LIIAEIWNIENRIVDIIGHVNIVIHDIDIRVRSKYKIVATEDQLDRITIVW